MTRTEFVKGYCDRSGIPEKDRGDQMILVGSRMLYPLPCDCGEDGCEGWAMVSEGSLWDHLFLYAPDTFRDQFREFVSRDTRG